MSALEQAPGPSPWYLRHTGSPAAGFTWGELGDSSQTAGAIALFGPSGAVLILDFHNYVLPLDPSTLLIWHQRHVQEGPTEPVMLRVFSLEMLDPLDRDLAGMCTAMRGAGRPYASSQPPLCEMAIPTTVAGQRRAFVYHERIRHLEELLILCASSGVEEPPLVNRENLTLMVARPAEGTYELFPQDWFNLAGLDYAYQGVTRVARDTRTGRIHGEGFRIAPFVLDETLRKTQKPSWLRWRR